MPTTDFVLPNEFSFEYLHAQALRHATDLTRIWNERNTGRYRKEVSNWVVNYFDNGIVDSLPVPPLKVEFYVRDSGISTRGPRELDRTVVDMWTPDLAMRKKIGSRVLQLIGLPPLPDAPSGIVNILFELPDGRFQAGSDDTIPSGMEITHGGVRVRKVIHQTPFGTIRWYERV